MRIYVKFMIFLHSWLRTPVERNLARTIARARWDLPTNDIDVCVLLNSRVRIVLKVRRFRYHDGIISEVSLQRNNQLVSQNVVLATLISPLHYLLKILTIITHPLIFSRSYWLLYFTCWTVITQ